MNILNEILSITSRRGKACSPNQAPGLLKCAAYLTMDL